MVNISEQDIKFPMKSIFMIFADKLNKRKPSVNLAAHSQYGERHSYECKQNQVFRAVFSATPVHALTLFPDTQVNKLDASLWPCVVRTVIHFNAAVITKLCVNVTNPQYEIQSAVGAGCSRISLTCLQTHRSHLWKWSADHIPNVLYMVQYENNLPHFAAASMLHFQIKYLLPLIVVFKVVIHR